MQHTTGSFVQIRFVPILLCLLKYLVADFVEHSDFLKEKKTQNFRLPVQHDATNVSLRYIIRQSSYLYVWDSDHYLFFIVICLKKWDKSDLIWGLGQISSCEWREKVLFNLDLLVSALVFDVADLREWIFKLQLRLLITREHLICLHTAWPGA